MVPINLWRQQEVGTGEIGTKEVESLLGKDVFDHPKPSLLIKRMLKMCTTSNNGNFVLDFFAGSGTTAQAVMELNKEDGGNREFILVQLPEKTDENSEAYKAKYFTIADICKERIRRVINRLNQDSHDSKINTIKDKAQQKLFIEGQNQENPANQINHGSDNGFKVFKLAPSNFKMWRSDIIETEEDLNKMVDLFDTQIKPDAKKENMLYELMLKSGFTLTDKVEKINGYYSVNDGQAVFVLDKIDQSIIGEIIKIKPQS
ncbi:MAG: DNA methyltransferase, partial [Ignavibacteriaceae bacterium]